jgi:hypothetical protein
MIGSFPPSLMAIRIESLKFSSPDISFSSLEILNFVSWSCDQTKDDPIQKKNVK